MPISNNRDEIDRQLRLEYGRRGELSIRFAGVLIGSVMLWLDTHWIAAPLWSFCYVAIHLLYNGFLRTRSSNVSGREIVVSHSLFLLVIISFLWLPVYMIALEDPALRIIGSGLGGCILVFLVRRNDTPTLMIAGQIAIIAASAVYVGVVYLAMIYSPLEKLGIFATFTALIYFFGNTLLNARDIQIAASEAIARSLQSEKLAAIGQLAGGVAHDFNNNLTAIMGNLELLDHIEDPAARQACLRDAQIASRQAAKTVHHLLVFARKERMTLEEQDLNVLLSDVVALTGRLIPASITLQTRTEPFPLGVLADKHQLSAALINLVVNARDAMPDGGTLTLSTASLNVPKPRAMADGVPLPAGDYATISTTDTGGGIPPDIRDKVLDPFFTTKPVGKGTGLGLPMALGMAREFGGALEITGTPQGTTVTILLPLRDPAPLMPPADRA